MTARRARRRQPAASSSAYLLEHPLRRWMLAIWTSIVIGACAATGLSVCVYNLVRPEDAINPIIMIGVVAPVGVTVGLLLGRIVHATTRRVQELLDALHAMAYGDFSVRLDVDSVPVFKPLFEDVNALAVELGNVQMLRENFVADFSHEFKTPINAINGFANLLLSGTVTPEEQTSYLQVIARESDRLAHLATNTLLLNRLDSQQFLERAPLSLDEQLRQAILMLEAQWGAKDIELVLDLPRVVVCGNEHLLAEVWVNLLGNACKFTEPGGRVWVRLRVEQGAGERAGVAVVEVGDTGIGMTPEQCARVFDRYYQADESRRTSGHGLGLAIAWRIVELSGGSIRVESTPGQGSTFIVTLPDAQTGTPGGRGGGAGAGMPRVCGGGAERTPVRRVRFAPVCARARARIAPPGDASC